MDYLYRALKKEAGEDTEPAESPKNSLIAAKVSAAIAVPEPETEPVHSVREQVGRSAASVPGGMSEDVWPDIVSSSDAIRQRPEKFYAFSVERMTKDRILALEQIRVLRSRVMELMRVQGVRTLLITSSVAEEGKTITSINLSLALSQVQSLRLLLIDCDLRKPSVANVLGASNDRGLLSYLLSETSFEDSVQHLNQRLSFLAAAKAHNSVELLHSGRMKDLIRSVREAYNLVIIDAPPLYSIADAQIVANYADAALLCIRAGHTPRDMVAESANMISEKLVGAVLVGGERQTHGYSYTYSRYSGTEATSK